MPRISKKLAVGGRASCKATVLPKDIIEQHLRPHGENWKNLRLNGTIIRELTTKKRRIFQVSFDKIENVVVDVLAGNLRYEKQAVLNREEEETAVTELLSAHEELSDDSESSLEEEERENIDVTDLSISINWREQPVTIDQRTINLVYNRECEVNISSISLVSPYESFRRFLPLNYIEQYVINSINKRGKDASNWVNVNINEYVRWLGLWVLMSAFPVADRRFYWRTSHEQTQPIVPFDFQRWMSRSRFEQIVLYHTLMMPSELDTPNLNDPLYSVRSFINAFNSNLVDAVKPGSTLCIDESMNSWLGEKNKIPGRRKIPRKPHPVGQEWKTIADSSTNIIIQLEPCEDKEIEKNKQFVSEYGSTAAYVLRLARPWFGSGRTIVGDSWFGSPKVCLLLMQNGLYGIFHVKKKRGWPLNYPRDMIQKLGNTYGSYFSKVAIVNSVQLIAASLKDRKPQCIIATASTTTQDDEVERIVKEHNNSSLVKFIRPKIFSEYSFSKGAVDINNQVFFFIIVIFFIYIWYLITCLIIV